MLSPLALSVPLGLVAVNTQQGFLPISILGNLPERRCWPLYCAAGGSERLCR